jgi:hypothetical protein
MCDGLQVIEYLALTLAKFGCCAHLPATVVNSPMLPCAAYIILCRYPVKAHYSARYWGYVGRAGAVYCDCGVLHYITLALMVHHVV